MTVDREHQPFVTIDEIMLEDYRPKNSMNIVWIDGYTA